MQVLFVGGPEHGKWHEVRPEYAAVVPLRMVVHGCVYVRDSVKWMERRDWKAQLFYRFESLDQKAMETDNGQATETHGHGQRKHGHDGSAAG